MYLRRLNDFANRSWGPHSINLTLTPATVFYAKYTNTDDKSIWKKLSLATKPGGSCISHCVVSAVCTYSLCVQGIGILHKPVSVHSINNKSDFGYDARKSEH